MVSRTNVFALIQTGLQDAFNNESQLELDRVKKFIGDVSFISEKLGHAYLPTVLDSISWNLNVSYLSEEDKKILVPNKWELIQRDGNKTIATYGWRDYRWNLEGRNGDIVAWKLI